MTEWQTKIKDYLGEGTYECTLDDKVLKKAVKELNEDPKQRALQIEALREWVKRQPHLNSRTDDTFLLRFLRHAKFSQLKAQKTLDNFWTVRTVEGKGAPEWFKSMDPKDPKNEEILDLGMQIPLPGRDDQGRKVILVRSGGYDPYKHDFGAMMKTSFMMNDILLMDEENQVHGFVLLQDFTDFGLAHATNWNREIIGKAMKCWQDMYPTRNKGSNFYNTPTIFNALMEVFKLFMKEKSKKRMKFHWSSIESLHKEVPKRILPDYMGGEAGSLEELKKNWKAEVMANREELLLNGKYGVDESKRPNEDASLGGMQGSFRKLAVD
ncbi:unnamed protein product [Owenia fusiformis]|uniref:Uncharacterized protein n=1 Tax=Owenia fusiformis TaxID=6347 RepID=A0A8J1XSQ6_OWEFU|nr:unnamed protein product [Owenia fusiformis]